MTNQIKQARKVEIIGKRGDIYDVAVNGKFIGCVTFVQGHGYSDGFNFHEALHLAVHSLAQNHK